MAVPTTTMLRQLRTPTPSNPTSNAKSHRSRESRPRSQSPVRTDPAVARRVEQSDRTARPERVLGPDPSLARESGQPRDPGPQRPVYRDRSLPNSAVSSTSKSWISTTTNCQADPVRTRPAHEPRTPGSREQQAVRPDTARTRQSHRPAIPVARRQRLVRTHTCRTGRSSHRQDSGPSRQPPAVAGAVVNLVNPRAGLTVRLP